MISKKDIKYIRKNPKKINWINFSGEENLSEDFIREFKNYVCWWNISCNSNCKLSESFIKEFKDYLYIGMVCSHQQLSENFLREFKNNLVWWRVSEYQNLSKEFIIEFYNKLDFNRLIDNRKISDEIKEFCRMFL